MGSRSCRWRFGTVPGPSFFSLTKDNAGLHEKPTVGQRQSSKQAFDPELAWAGLSLACGRAAEAGFFRLRRSTRDRRAQ